MQPTKSQHPLSATLAPLDDAIRDAMWELFVQIGKFWKNIDDPSEHKPRVYSFMENRIALDPMYRDYYITANNVIKQLVDQYGEVEGYHHLFTDPDAMKSPPATPLALTRQKVSNEFVSLQLAVGGFKAFGAKNYCGFIGGAYVPSAPVPYRTMENHDAG
jgi:hypothetical protein